MSKAVSEFTFILQGVLLLASAVLYVALHMFTNRLRALLREFKEVFDSDTSAGENADV